MGKTQQQGSSKKARVESPMGMAMGPSKTEEVILEEDEKTGANALVAVEGAAAGVEITVRIPMTRLHCPICTLPLKPPIFQCAAGHLACGVCHDELAGDGRCFVCGHAGGTYGRIIVLEDFVRAARILCPYDAYGCRSYVVYYDAAEHQRACPHAPCRCSEPGCAFVGSPPMLRDHLGSTHSWPVEKIRYGSSCQLWLPESQPRQLLVAEEDGRVFLLSVSVAPLRGVNLECLRASAAEVGPHYTCKMWAVGSAAAPTGKVPSVFVDMDVPSSSVPGEAAAAEDEEVPQLVVKRKMLHGPSKAIRLSVKIEKMAT